MTKLFLDDFREPPDFSWDVVRSYDAFVAYFAEHGCPDFISFDHDLGYICPDGKTMLDFTGKPIDAAKWTEKNGYDCAKWMLENGHKPKAWRVHSMNPVGAKRIRDLLLGESHPQQEKG